MKSRKGKRFAWTQNPIFIEALELDVLTPAEAAWHTIKMAELTANKLPDTSHMQTGKAQRVTVGKHWIEIRTPNGQRVYETRGKHPVSLTSIFRLVAVAKSVGVEVVDAR
jgi:hypothetical protein